MSDVAIRVEHLSKQYRLGGQQATYATFRETLVEAAKTPLRWLKGERQPRQDTFWALDDVSFEVKHGEAVGIIGRNGAGKSTLLKILSRITSPTRGRADLYGRVGSLLEVGTGFHPELTGRENIYLNGAILGMSRVEIARKFDEIVAFAEIEKFLDTPVKHYSSGMYVRLAFAVAAHLEPEILIVDEVLAVGDAQFQKKCLGKMGDVTRQGRTVLFVSHNMAAVSQLCSKAILLERGCLQRSGEPINIISNYLSVDSLSQGFRSWKFPNESPGDDKVRLLSIRIIQDNNQVNIININKEFLLEIEFVALQKLKNLITAMNFFDISDICLFCTADWRENVLLPGIYKKILKIPSNIFAEGKIRILVQLVFYEPDIRSVVLPEAITFEAVDSGEINSVRGMYKGAWPGVLRLKLDWSENLKTGGLYL